jgi:hypothetical protein
MIVAVGVGAVDLFALGEQKQANAFFRGGRIS